MTKIKKASKVWLKKTSRLLRDTLERFGASPLPSGHKWQSMYPSAMETLAGELVLDLDDRGEYGINVFGRFTAEDLKPARALVDCNPYSGKWNQHFFPSHYTPEDAERVLRYWLRIITGRDA